jgi:CheY-like chemotaxis protein
MSQVKVLCVDDDPDVLDGLKHHLVRRFEVHLATSGPAGLELIASKGPFAVVMSDMRMPQMNGAAFLAKVREAAPDTVRMLLTGQTDLESAVLAVNEGQIFRFLLKPCSPDLLRRNFELAAEQYRLLHVEHELLERTLRGSVQALVEALALTSPLAFGRATRLHKHVAEMCDELAFPQRWQPEIAALVSELGAISVSDELFERYYHERQLSVPEQKLVAELPKATRRILNAIPRLEPVLELLTAHEKWVKQSVASALPGAALLQIAYDFDVLETRGMDSVTALETLQSRRGGYDAAALAAFARRRSHGAALTEVREISLLGLHAGMVFAEDVRTENGTLLAARGYEVTPAFEAKLMSFRRGQIKEPLRVIIKRRPAVA